MWTLQFNDRELKESPDSDTLMLELHEDESESRQEPPYM